MIRHIVLVTFKPDTPPEQVDAWYAAVRGMCENSPEVLYFSLGSNIGSGPNHRDAALVADFRDMDQFRAYIKSPSHAAYVETHGRVVVDKLAAIQHEI